MSCHVMSCHVMRTIRRLHNIVCAHARARARARPAAARARCFCWLAKGVRHAESSRGLLAAALTVCQHRVATVIIIV